MAPELSENDDSDEGESSKWDQLIQEDAGRALLRMTNFTVSEFNGVWNQVQDHVSSRYNSGRGTKSSIKAQYIYFYDGMYTEAWAQIGPHGISSI